MIKGRTVSGFEFEINESNLDDMRFVDALATLDKGNFLALSHVADMMFDTAQKDRLYSHLAEQDKEGKVRIESFAKEIVEILNYQESTKN